MQEKRLDQALMAIIIAAVQEIWADYSQRSSREIEEPIPLTDILLLHSGGR